MSDGDNNAGNWSLAAYIAHNESMRRLEDKYQSERDRRYTEVKQAEEKALKIKEEADRTALGLQRETQTYKDEKANELREQISSERGLYATHSDLIAAVGKLDATLLPVMQYISSQQGGYQSKSDLGKWIFASIAALGTLVGLGATAVAVVVYLVLR